GFRHNEQSLRVVDVLEKGGKGLNLTEEVRDGIKNHRTNTVPHTPEGAVVRISDKIAYINHDIDDAIKSGILRTEDIPAHISKRIGYTTGKRIDSMLREIIANSSPDNITAGEEMDSLINELRAFMFKRVYFGEKVNKEVSVVDKTLSTLFEWYMERPSEMGDTFKNLIYSGESTERAVCDYIAFMTDDFALKKYSAICSGAQKRQSGIKNGDDIP
ncbi:MAG: deoxyguanosinetriphosphate triphosphohydrolase, partial [Firmicutes bacterium]|nr:deoxyguanosinetriphosphate triphosphohydrolase [Bacillota bacterium]